MLLKVKSDVERVLWCRLPPRRGEPGDSPLRCASPGIYSRKIARTTAVRLNARGGDCKPQAGITRPGAARNPGNPVVAELARVPTAIDVGILANSATAARNNCLHPPRPPPPGTGDY